MREDSVPTFAGLDQVEFAKRIWLLYGQEAREKQESREVSPAEAPSLVGLQNEKKGAESKARPHSDINHHTPRVNRVAGKRFGATTAPHDKIWAQYALHYYKLGIKAAFKRVQTQCRQKSEQARRSEAFMAMTPPKDRQRGL